MPISLARALTQFPHTRAKKSYSKQVQMETILPFNTRSLINKTSSWLCNKCVEQGAWVRAREQNNCFFSLLFFPFFEDLASHAASHADSYSFQMENNRAYFSLASKAAHPHKATLQKSLYRFRCLMSKLEAAVAPKKSRRKNYKDSKRNPSL